MKYGINHWVYNDEPLRDTFARLAKYGYDGVELKGEPGTLSTEEINTLRKEYALDVTSVLGWSIAGIPGRDFSSPDETERSAALRYGQACLEFAAAVGAPILLVLPFPAGRTAPLGNPASEQEYLAAKQREWENAVASIRQTARAAAVYGITLAVEPINRFETFQITTLDDALRFIEDVGEPNVGLNLDTFHMNIDEADPVGAIRRAGSRLVHMHVADSNRLVPGKGHIDFRQVMAALLEIGFNGAVVLEAVPAGADPGMAIQLSSNLPLRDSFAEENIRYLKRLEAAGTPV